MKKISIVIHERGDIRIYQMDVQPYDTLRDVLRGLDYGQQTIIADVSLNSSESLKDGGKYYVRIS